MVWASERARGLLIGGLGVGAGEEVTGLAMGGLGVGTGGRLCGIALGSLGVGAPSLTGIAVGGLGVGGEEVTGVSLAGLYFRIEPGGRLRGLTVSALNNINRGAQHGLAIGLLNVAAELHGLQLGLLNIARNNPRGLRVLPLVNAHFD